MMSRLDRFDNAGFDIRFPFLFPFPYNSRPGLKHEMI